MEEGMNTTSCASNNTGNKIPAIVKTNRRKAVEIMKINR